jgi:ABC-type glycerol-3-phosphate transport system substrate-binding protein
LPATNMWASRSANMQNPELTDLGDVIGFGPAPRATADGLRAGSAFNDFYMIPANTTVDPELVFLIMMEAVDERSQQDAAKVGMTTRLAVSDNGGKYLPAAGQTIAEGVGSYANNPAVALVRTQLSAFLPLVGSGEMTAQEALDAAAAAYTEEATTQGYIE